METHSARGLFLLLLISVSVIVLFLSQEILPEKFSWTTFSDYDRSREARLFKNVLQQKRRESTPLPQNTKTAQTTRRNSVTRARTHQKTESPETPIPLILRTSFNKLPQWDFEDIYNQDAPPRPTTCAQSLRNTKDETFQKAFLPNVRLYLHKDNINMSEWNRLSHFNNPFGFMEMKYDEVMAAVKLIPKPNEPLLLPKPGGDGCVHCAVVGTGGILNGSKMGAEIDAHDYVFRMNGAAIKGYEVDVGKRTSVYVHTAHSITASLLLLQEYGYMSAPHDEGIKYVLIPEGLRDFQWLQSVLKGEQVSSGEYENENARAYYSGQYNESRFYVLHQDFLRYVRNRFLKSDYLNEDFWAIVRPTNGAFSIFLALHTCDTVSLYGFMTEDYDKYSNYYVDKHSKSEVIFYANHDLIQEKNLWKSLHEKQIIKLYQRSGS